MTRAAVKGKQPEMGTEAGALSPTQSRAVASGGSETHADWQAAGARLRSADHAPFESPKKLFLALPSQEQCRVQPRQARHAHAPLF